MKTYLRSVGTCVGVFAFVTACAQTQAPNTDPSPGPAPTDRVCTQIGCLNGLLVRVAKATPWVPGRYTFELDLDGVQVSCSGALPLQPCESGPSLACTGDGKVIISESGCALPPESQGFGDLQISGEPQSVGITIKLDDSVLHTTTLNPSYVTSQPNGPGCEPTCRSGSGDLELP